ncbi:ubiquitin-like domain-containing protein [Lysinibacillus sp. 3P01SB]|uniref:ubiquitin-like domain-containing protein n=1 Tax=Lysinibacillus sp. 3P01SB TaxID=3132284 RepID=UPI0039A60BAF
MSNDTMKNLFFGSLRSKQTVVRLLSLVLFVSIIVFVLYQGTKNSVVINANGEQLEVATHEKTVEDVLATQNIAVSEYDKVSPSLDTKVVSGMTIDWEQAKEIIISVDGNQSSIWTTEKRVKNILEEANIEVAEHDEISLSLDTEVGADHKIDIQKAFQLTLVDGLEERQVWSTSTTVANFLKQQGITLGEYDRIGKSMEEVITPDDRIAVVRVEKVTDVVEESIDFAIEKKTDSSLLKGKEKVVTTGKKGTVERTFEVVKENGQVVSKTLQKENVVKKPTKQVVAVGTKVITASVSRNNSAAPSNGKEFYVTATAYTANCSGCSGVTATGLNLKANPSSKVIAVDPSVIPLGSKVWVEGYGYAIAADTGGAIKGNKIDVFISSKSQAASWGRKKVRIKVLN